MASGLYTGYSPVASGTIGSVLGVLIFLQLHNFPLLYICVCLVLILLGFLISGRAEAIYKQKDSRRIVIDEIASMCLVYLFIKPTRFMLISGFILFRIFDIIKPPPAKKLQALHGSIGVMLDDVVAAFYTIIVLFIVNFLFCNYSAIIN